MYSHSTILSVLDSLQQCPRFPRGINMAQFCVFLTVTFLQILPVTIATDLVGKQLDNL